MRILCKLKLFQSNIFSQLTCICIRFKVLQNSCIVGNKSGHMPMPSKCANPFQSENNNISFTKQIDQIY